jgi:hypothetical protein
MSRFVVDEVHGFEIRPNSNNSGNSHRPLPVSFVVLDSGWCYHLCGEFPPGDRSGVGYNPVARRRAQAEALAARLEREYGP